MRTKVQALTIITLGATLVIASAQTAQPTAAASAPPPPALSPTEQMIKDIKNPTSWMTWGADMRLRNEYFNNAQTLTSDPTVNPRFYDLHSQDYFRFRGRIWTTFTPVQDLNLNVRLAAEPREWMESSSSGTFLRQSGLEWRYGIFDNLNVNWTNIAGLPARIKVGRQDVRFSADPFPGDGWLIADGTPNDGSWTFFMDSVRATINLEEQKTKIDMMGIFQYAEPDEWLPTIGSSTTAGSPNRYTLTDQNEKGAILWVANKSVKPANLDGYFIYKHDTRNSFPPGATSAANGTGTYANGDNADIFTVGGRVSGLVKEHWQYSAEGAYQFGRKQDPKLLNSDAGAAAALDYHDLHAFGVNSRLGYLFKDSMANEVYLAYEFLSGDNPGTGNDEMFDVLWGRWPRWSELYAPYSYIPESRTAQMANIWRLGPGWSFIPIQRMNFSVNYNVMFAQQDVPTRANVPTAFTGTDGNPGGGNFRGHYLQAILKYQFSRHMSGHLWSEFVFPGNYYVSDQTMTFLRAELWFTF